MSRLAGAWGTDSGRPAPVLLDLPTGLLPEPLRDPLLLEPKALAGSGDGGSSPLGYFQLCARVLGRWAGSPNWDTRGDQLAQASLVPGLGSHLLRPPLVRCFPG